MVTGDHPSTAEAISRRIGIITAREVRTVQQHQKGKQKSLSTSDGGQRDIELAVMAESGGGDFGAAVITGEEIPRFDADTWDLVFKHEELIFARTTPEQKLTIVKEAQKRKYTVAVTGDGVNDAAALKQADVGVAMGGGSDVAREAAKLVLLTDNFSSIVYGIEQGRVFYANLKKLCMYYLPAGCFSEFMPALFSYLFGIPLPLSTLQMIVISTFTDMLPSLSLIYEKAESDVMTSPPRSRGEYLVGWRVLLHVFCWFGPLVTLGNFFMWHLYFSHWGNLQPKDLWLAYEKYPTTDSSNYTDPNGLSTGTWTSYKGQDFDALQFHLYRAQTVYFVTLVITNFFIIQALRTRRLSAIFQHPWWAAKSRNLRLPLAILGSLVILLLFVFIPVPLYLLRTLFFVF